MLEIDWNPIRCNLEAMRLEIRAYSFALAATTPGMRSDRAGEYLQRMEFEQHNADLVSAGQEREQ